MIALPETGPGSTPDMLKYFWLLVAGVMAFNIVALRRRMLVVVQRNNATRAEVDRFVRWLGVWLVGGPLVYQASQIGAGWSSPLCQYSAPAGSPPAVTASIIAGTGAVAMLHWIWRGRGADFLARVAPAFQQRPNYEKVFIPSLVRVYVTIVILVLMLTPLLSRWAVHAPSTAGCTAPFVSGARAGPNAPIDDRHGDTG